MSPEQIEMWREVAMAMDSLAKLAHKSGWAATGSDLMITARDIRLRIEARELRRAYEGQGDFSDGSGSSAGDFAS